MGKLTNFVRSRNTVAGIVSDFERTAKDLDNLVVTQRAARDRHNEQAIASAQKATEAQSEIDLALSVSEKIRGLITA